MFHTFASANTASGRAAQRQAKRFKVQRACNYCREHRVKCDAEFPCARCVANNIECVHTPPSRRPQAGSQNSSPRSTSQPIEDSGNARRLEEPVAEPLPQQTTSATNTPPRVNGKSDSIDSTVGFMSKISAFCATYPLLSTDDDSPPPYPSPSCPVIFNTASSASSLTLTKVQLARLLDIYWARCHPFVPIVDRTQVDAICQGLWDTATSEPNGRPLLDGVLALCISYLEESDLHNRLLGLQWIQQESSITYFRRCLASTSQYATFAEPSLERIQCYVFMTIYLLDTGQHQPAYNMVGLALRMAHTLNLHQGLPDTEPHAQIARRLWWTILRLDFRCARLLGRPVGVRLSEATCTLPAPDDYPYHTRAVSLTWATLSVTEAMARNPIDADRDLVQQVESRAASLSNELYRLHKWRDVCLCQAIQRPLHVDHRGHHDWITQSASNDSIQLLYGVLLELQYYDEVIGLHRPFICLPNGGMASQRSPRADACATYALSHAIATVDLAFRVMSATDVLHGRSDVYQWQWNAFLTLIGFLMAYPLCDYSSIARRHTQLALEIFGAANPKNTVAVRAAALGRSLCTKVDSLVQGLKSDGQPVEAVNVAYGNSKMTEDAPITEDATTLNFDSDDLWSWTAMTNPELWTAYSDGVSCVLADFPDSPLGQDGLGGLL